MSVGELFDERLVLVTGKGGVGRSTCAVGLAVAAAQRGKKTLLVEVSQRAASSEILGSAPAVHEPRRPAEAQLPSLFCARLDARRSLEEYLTEHLGLGRLVRLALENRVLSRLWSAMPSVNEMAFLNTVFHHEKATGADGQPVFDLIVLDMPATGHALAMLGVPRGLLGIVGVGPIARRAREIDAFLHDRSRTAVCVVTLPEELPVNESVELVHKLASLGFDTRCVLVNGVVPTLLDPEERAWLDRLRRDLSPSGAQAVLEVAQRLERRRLQQQRSIETLHKAVGAELVEIAETARRGLDLAYAVAAALVRARPAWAPA